MNLPLLFAPKETEGLASYIISVHLMSSPTSSTSSDKEDKTEAKASAEPTPTELWEIFFPFETAYDAQADGIETITSLIAQHDTGYAVLEGACGTGKTLLALVSGLAVTRSPHTTLNRLFIATSVKQQLEAFEDDLDTLNNHLRGLDSNNYDVGGHYLKPITALTLVGKQDVCPYTFSGHIDSDNIYAGCSQLQETTRAMINHYSSEQNQARAAAKLVDSADQSSDSADTTRAVDDVDSHPYQSAPPENTNTGSHYCPYYAQTLLDEITESDPIPLKGSILTPERLANHALQQGSCPYESMKEAASDAEVLLGNYAHILQPQTLQAFTNQLIGDDTFLICDEAHTLPEKAKSAFSHHSTLTELSDAINEIEQVEEWIAEGPRELSEDISTALSQACISETDLQQFRNLVAFSKDMAEHVIPQQAADADASLQQLRQLGKDMNRPEYIPLREPTEATVDGITRQYNTTDYAQSEVEVARFGRQVSEAVSDIYHAATEVFPSKQLPDTLAIDTAGPFLQEYFLSGHQDYFREAIAVPQSDYRVPQLDDGPVHTVNIPQPIVLRVKNCFPASNLAHTLSKFGGGICMSATLTPQWAYKHEIGLDYLDSPVKTLSYGLDFPKQNRQTLAVTLNKYTASNRIIREDDSPEEQEAARKLRDRYATAVKHVVRETPGNILVAGPSYAEAEWIANELQDEQSIDKPVLRDESSSNAETYALRDRFITGPPKVLTSSMLGTITEGVDYDGDALKAIAVFGVPIENTTLPSKRAEQLAYDEHFDTNSSNGQGFQLAHLVPAVRKARQAIGRVIRSTSDVGVRVLIDTRYTKNPYNSYLTEQEQKEITITDHTNIKSHLRSFWNS